MQPHPPPLNTNVVGKLSLYAYSRQKQEEDSANAIPERTRQEPTVPLTARPEPKGGNGVEVPKKNKSWNNEGLDAPAVPLTARNAHTNSFVIPAMQEAETPRLDSQRGEVDLKLPITPAQALRQYKNSMNIFEQGEILDYPQV